MPIYIKDNKELLYIHIPKCAGSTLRNLLKKSSKFEYLYHPGKKTLPCSPQHFHNEYLKLVFNNRSVNSFCVVRHPLTRIISEYYYRRKKGRIRDGMNVNKFIRTSLEKYSENEFIHDNHIRPMNQFILENTKIFKLEDGMSKIINYICDFFSYQKPEISTPPKNVSEYDDFIIKKSTIDLVNDFYSEDFTFFDYKKVEISKKNISFSELKSKIEATYD